MRWHRAWGLVLAASGLTALACGRNPIEWAPLPAPDAATDAKPATGPDDAGADVAAPPHPDAGGDGTTSPPDTRPPDATAVDRPPMVDARDVAEARPDLANDPPPVPPPVDVRPPIDAACPVDCSRLPHVASGVFVECRNGQCIVPLGACQAGFAHCSANSNDGCETDLSRPESCGSCGWTCSAFYPDCHVDKGTYACGPHCQAPFPNACGFACVDVQTDSYNCGRCGFGCYLPNAFAQCQQGVCTMTGCSDPNYADCTSDPGCETPLGTDGNCGGCGDQACALANTMLTCSNGAPCDAAVCAPGFANCNATSADCEASFASAPACMPAYLGTSPLATQSLDYTATAVAPDGSVLLTGTFNGSVDFDPTAGRDVRLAPSDWDGFVTKINADGGYGWTRVFSGRGDNIAVPAVAVSATGAVVVTGWYSDTIDLDPGATSDVRFTTTPFQNDAFVVKLAADGSYLWGRTFAGSSGAQANAYGVSVDAAEAVYVAGSFSGEVDFDPGAGVDLHMAPQDSGVLVKLTAAGTLGWARSFENGDCGTSLASVTVATDGSLWGAGSTWTGATCTRFGQDQDRQDDVLIVKLGDAGDDRGTWVVGSAGNDNGNAVSAGPGGSVYVGGVATGLIDLDPGPGTAARWTGPYSGGFVLKLGVAGTFAWARTFADATVLGLAGAPDGGVIAAASGNGALVARLSPDGVGVWTFGIGAEQTTIRTVAARGGSFSISGSTGGGSADFNPGPDVDPIYGDVVYVSRFRF